MYFWPWYSGEDDENVKSLRTDDEQQVIKDDDLSFQVN